jgi:hypothetical protein
MMFARGSKGRCRDARVSGLGIPSFADLWRVSDRRREGEEADCLVKVMADVVREVPVRGLCFDAADLSGAVSRDWTQSEWR